MINPEVIIYDFDGVICDSVNVKTEAFVELYKDYGLDIQAKVREYHILNGGISRFEKFRYFQSVLLNQEVSENDIKELADKFALLVKEKVIASEYISGAYEFIKKNAFRKQFVCTGTPETEIIEIAERKGISQFFKNFYGSPKTKIEIIDLILAQNFARKEECIFFGDAMTDFNAAYKCNLPFIGIKNNHTDFPSGTIIIEDFTDKSINIF